MSIQFSESTFRALERLRTEPPSSEQYRGNPGIPPAARCHTGEAHTGNLGEPHPISVDGGQQEWICSDVFSGPVAMAVYGYEATALLSVFRHLDLELLSSDDRAALLSFKSRLRDCFG
jgi:hypothetical protein